MDLSTGYCILPYDPVMTKSAPCSCHLSYSLKPLYACLKYIKKVPSTSG